MARGKRKIAPAEGKEVRAENECSDPFNWESSEVRESFTFCDDRESITRFRRDVRIIGSRSIGPRSRLSACPISLRIESVITRWGSKFPILFLCMILSFTLQCSVPVYPF